MDTRQYQSSGGPRPKEVSRHRIPDQYRILLERFTCCDDQQFALTLVPDQRTFSYTQCELDEVLDGRHAWNGKTLVLQELDIDTRVVLRVSEGYYYDTLVASRRLRFESATHAVTNNGRDQAQGVHGDDPPRPGSIDDDLELLGNRTNIWGKEGISAALSVSTAFFVFDGNEYLLAYSRRSRKVAEHSGLYHLAPSMLLQPREDLSSAGGYQVVRNMVFQEIAEEIFSEPEKSHLEPPDQADAPPPAIQDLAALLDRGAAEFVITGLATDVTSVRPEILTTLIVHDASWYNGHKAAIRLCAFEYEDQSNQQANTPLFKSFDAEELFAPSGPFSPGCCVPTAAACLMAGLDRLESARHQKFPDVHQPLHPRKIPEIRPAIEPDQNLLDRISEALTSGSVTNNGARLRQFERKAAKFLGVERALAVSNGSDALYIALKLFSIENKKRVVLPSYTYRATLNAVTENGLTPLFCDIDRESFTICPKHLRSLLERYGDIGCIIPVNVFGVSPDLSVIRKLADQHQSHVVYDNAQGFGARYHGQGAPGEAHIQIFSLHATKILPAVEGGLIVSTDSDVMNEVDVIRGHGISRTSPRSWHWGINSKLDEIRAMIGLHSLEQFDQILARRRSYGATLLEAVRRGSLRDIFTPQMVPDYCSTNYQNFAIALQQPGERDALISRLKALGIGCRSYFDPPLHHLDCFDENEELRNTEHVWENLISLPMHSRMSEEELDMIVSGLLQVKPVH